MINKKYTTAAIINCLRKIACSNEDENIYLFDYRNEISNAIGDAFGIDFIGLYIPAFLLSIITSNYHPGTPI